LSADGVTAGADAAVSICCSCDSSSIQSSAVGISIAVSSDAV